MYKECQVAEVIATPKDCHGIHQAAPRSAQEQVNHIAWDLEPKPQDRELKPQDLELIASFVMQASTKSLTACGV